MTSRLARLVNVESKMFLNDKSEQISKALSALKIRCKKNNETDLNRKLLDPVYMEWGTPV